ncbi:MAG TPA: hypothetical protein VKZ64_01850, partial [Arenimonas sp.]|nr:hypothetical protein [Arenimonas sp.]
MPTSSSLSQWPRRPARWRRWAAHPALHRVLGHIAPEASGRLAQHLVLWPNTTAPATWELPALQMAQPVTFRFGQRALRWGDSGPVVLAMHGWEGRPSQFAALLPALLAAGRQVIAPYGPEHQPGHRGFAHVLVFRQFLLEAAAELRGVESVIGHSMGGAAALLALRDGLSAERVLTLAAPSALAHSLLRSARGLSLTPRAHRRFRRLVDERVGLPARQIDVAPQVAGLPVPAMLVHDHDDGVVPVSEARRLRAALPNARLLLTRGLRHGRVLTD